MVYEKTQTFERKEKDLDEFQQAVEQVMNATLRLSTKAAKLDETLSIITFIDEKMDLAPQKDNKVSLYQEQSKIFIQLKGILDKDQADEFWDALNDTLSRSKIKEPVTKELKIESKPPTKEDTINAIIAAIKDKGASIEKTDAEEFIDNFQEQFNRLPAKSEINSIALGYIKMMDVDPVPKASFSQIKDSPPTIKTQPQVTAPPIVSPENTYKEDLEIYKEPSHKIEQTSSVKEAEPIERIELSSEEDFISMDPEIALKKIKFLSSSTVNNILKMIQKLPEERQKEIIERVKEIGAELELSEKENGIIITEWERNEFLLELIKLTKANRKEKFNDLIKDRKQEMIINKINEEIPQLKYEDNEKIIKELLWLTVDEIDDRINKIKASIVKKLEKKQELFSKSTAGTTCPNCGWPVGSFSKKCIRCGQKLIDWL